MNIIQKYTPNKSSRIGYKPELIVIHIMDGTLSGTDSWFASPKSEVSAHYGIGLNGEIHQYVEDIAKAWHAGTVENPNFKLYKYGLNPNLYTIGIEHEGKDLSKNSEIQLQTSANLIREICLKWNIPIDRDHIIGHYQIRSSKPNCPATDKTVIDRLVRMASGTEELVTIQVPKSKVDRVLSFIKSI